ncbi:hypothetical protein IGI04_001355 [Brassica rapa subsp. trilocularis]|uniref:UBR-type domain-containing protein n=1 Tax=Brassica rapa subsp. trilocularis TaxID=1813537 RepID=A0ABQ7NSM7_BRACM|nr:hypothetical protein IGI04_001355 [Brassica rapa subsp. trilocularis]
MASGDFEDDAEATVTMEEYIESMDAEELEADLVLGGDEGDECTYPKGYMKRQAIFSCITCTPEGNAGVCTACCLTCHDGHELLELWTKRNFRCDCGNSKFGTLACKLLPGKDVENSENSYNHNFKGLYCSCDKPYPDPNGEEHGEMIQCCICEDWFHEEHLSLKSSDGVSSQIPRDEEGVPVYEDFICQNCSPVCSFLTLYPEKLWVAAKVDSNGSANACADTTESNQTSTATEPVQPENSTEAEKSVLRGCSEKLADSEPFPAAGCAISKGLTSCPEFEKKPLFVTKNWRNMLCKCEKCLEMYSERKVSYLLDAEDTIAEYENKAKEKRTEKLEKQEGEALDHFNNLDHVTKVELSHGIKDFKEGFRSLLESVGTSRAITSEDVEEMFSKLKNKRKRME